MGQQSERTKPGDSFYNEKKGEVMKNRGAILLNLANNFLVVIEMPAVSQYAPH